MPEAVRDVSLICRFYALLQFVLVRINLREEKSKRTQQQHQEDMQSGADENQSTENHSSSSASATKAVDSAAVVTDQDELARSLMLLRYIAPNEKKILSSEFWAGAKRRTEVLVELATFQMAGIFVVSMPVILREPSGSVSTACPMLEISRMNASLDP